MSNSFVHIELSTDDLKKAKAFYKAIFDWKLADVPMGPGMTYTTVDAGKGKTGGGMTAKMMPEQPTAWLPYVEVDDVKKTIAKAKKRGADIKVDYQAIPNMGAFGIFVDPTGAAIGVYEQSKKVASKPAKKAPKKAAKKVAKKK